MSKNKKFKQEIQAALKKRRKATSLFMDVYYTKDGETSNTDVHWQEVYEFVKNHAGPEQAKVIADNYELFAEVNSMLIAKQIELFVKIYNDVQKDTEEIHNKFYPNQKLA